MELIVPQEDINLEFLRSQSPEWNMHNVVWRNKLELEKMSLDDLYNNLKVYEPEVKGSSSSSSSAQNIAFVSSSNNNSGNTNEAVTITNGVGVVRSQVSTIGATTIDNLSDSVIYAFLAGQSTSTQIMHEYWNIFTHMILKSWT